MTTQKPKAPVTLHETLPYIQTGRLINPILLGWFVWKHWFVWKQSFVDLICYRSIRLTDSLLLTD
jgi:hypothetical protein